MNPTTLDTVRQPDSYEKLRCSAFDILAAVGNLLNIPNAKADTLIRFGAIEGLITEDERRMLLGFSSRWDLR